MPVSSVNLSSIDETVTKPVILQACRAFAKRTHIGKFSYIDYIDYTGESIPVDMDGDGQLLKLNTERRLMVTSVEVPLEDSINTNQVSNRQGLRVLFDDPDIGVRVIVGRLKYKITLNCTYSASSKAELQSYTDQFLTDLSLGGYNNIFNALMELVLPKDTVTLLYHLYSKKVETGYEAEPNFIKYLKDHSDHTFRIKSDLKGSDFSFVFTEDARGMHLVAPPTPLEVSKEDSVYTTTIPLEFTFNRPTIAITRYPIFIGFKEINAAFFDKTANANIYKTRLSNVEPNSLMSNLYMANNMLERSDVRPTNYILPAYDEVVVDLNGYDQTAILQQRFFYNKTDPRKIVNLKTLMVRDDVSFQKDMLTYIARNKDLAFRWGRLFINLLIVNNGKVLDVDKYYIDDNLDIRCVHDLNPLGSYHILITTNKAPADMIESIFPTIVGFPDLVNAVIQHLFPYTPESWYPKPLPPSDKFPNGSIDKGELIEVLDKLPKSRASSRGQMITANALVVITKNK